MARRIHAIFHQGAFHPEEPVDIADGARVSLDVEPAANPAEDLSDVRDLLDIELMESYRRANGSAPSLESVQSILSVLKGSLADRISQERDER